MSGAAPIDVRVLGPALLLGGGRRPALKEGPRRGGPRRARGGLRRVVPPGDRVWGEELPPTYHSNVQDKGR